MIKKEPAYSVEILWMLYHPYDTITSKDVENELWISLPHASNLLRYMWRKGWLSRKLEYLKPHGRHYRYTMTEKGCNLIEWLDSRGVIELPK